MEGKMNVVLYRLINWLKDSRRTVWVSDLEGDLFSSMINHLWLYSIHRVHDINGEDWRKVFGLNDEGRKKIFVDWILGKTGKHDKDK